MPSSGIYKVLPLCPYSWWQPLFVVHLRIVSYSCRASSYNEYINLRPQNCTYNNLCTYFRKMLLTETFIDYQTRWPSDSTLLRDKWSRKRPCLLQMCGRTGDEEQAEGLLSACSDRCRKVSAPAAVLRFTARGHCTADGHTWALRQTLVCVSFSFVFSFHAALMLYFTYYNALFIKEYHPSVL